MGPEFRSGSAGIDNEAISSRKRRATQDFDANDSIQFQKDIFLWSIQTIYRAHIYNALTPD